MSDEQPAAALAGVQHQATCVAVNGRGVLIEGAPGSGKSSLALALIDRGAVLVGDDGVVLRADAQGRLLADPHPATRGLLEVRGVGLLPFEVADAVVVALVIVLDPAAPRHVEAAARTSRGGVELPVIALLPGAAVQALRAELALQRHGLGGDTA